MSKTRSKIKLCIIAILTIIGLVLTFASFVVPTTNTTYKGFINAINYGYDIGGGRLSVFNVTNTGLSDSDFNKKLDETVYKLSSAFNGYGLNVTRQDKTVRIEVSTYDDEDLSSIFSRVGLSSDLFSVIGAEKGISFNDSSSEYNAEGSITSEYVKGCKIESSQAQTDGSNVYPVTIEFTEEGTELFKTLTTNIANTTDAKLYMYINGENYYSDGFSITDSISSLTLSSTSLEGAKVLQLQVNALAKPLTLSKVVDSTITGGLNTSAGAFWGNAKTLLAIALSAIVLLSMGFLIVRYRMLGVFASMAILIFAVIYCFLLQSIPLVLLDLNGLLGAILVYGLLMFSFVDIFEKIRTEYSLGKKIPNSVMSGFRKKILPTLEKYVFLLIFAMVAYIVGSSAFKALAVTLFVGLFVNFFVLFVCLRGMCKLYLPLNSTKAVRYNLRREDNKNEI